jgi:glutamate dehydrogenase (NAD(P)+)
VAIHGFGKVAIPAALDLHREGAKICAVSDVSGAIYNSNGLDIEDVVSWVGKRRFLQEYDKECEFITNDELLELDVDILIPAAIDSVITDQNAHKVKAKLIAEGANGPLTKEAIDILSDRGVFIIPDILCNAGGVIVSYFEWVQGLQHFFWDIDEINKKLHDILFDAFKRVLHNAEEYKIDMKKAAFLASLQRLEGAMKLRGMWP